jgi:23S rRNA A1618 N6-methylase RlmF
LLRLIKRALLHTDINDDSLASAQRNVALNGFEDAIEIRRVQCDDAFFADLQPGETFDFCMCNPPYFDTDTDDDDTDDADDATDDDADATEQHRNNIVPSSSSTTEFTTRHDHQHERAATGARHELETRGGELQFANRLVRDSYQLFQRSQQAQRPTSGIALFTLLVGRKSSVPALVAQLQQLDRGASTTYRVLPLSPATARAPRHLVVWWFDRNLTQ